MFEIIFNPAYKFGEKKIANVKKPLTALTSKGRPNDIQKTFYVLRMFLQNVPRLKYYESQYSDSVWYTKKLKQ